MTTRTYYLPKNRISINILNFMVSKVGCSIGDLKISQKADTIRFPVTCNEKDVQRIEHILKVYGIIGE